MNKIAVATAVMTVTAQFTHFSTFPIFTCITCFYVKFTCLNTQIYDKKPQIVTLFTNVLRGKTTILMLNRQLVMEKN